MSIFEETFHKNSEKEYSPTWLIEVIEHGPNDKGDIQETSTDTSSQMNECYFEEVNKYIEISQKYTIIQFLFFRLFCIKYVEVKTSIKYQQTK